ncbi:MAG: lipopolysaccharide biosynthesis protein [Maribacter sp.]
MRNVSSQMMGAGVGQLLPFLATPILTRIFSETEFALFTAFFAIAVVLEVGAGGRYQFAIVLPTDEKKANQIFSLSILITIVYSIALFVMILIIPNNDWLNIGYSIYFLPLYILFSGIWSSFSNLSVRHKTFKDNAVAKVIQSFFYIVTSIGLGLARFILYGLILGKIFGFLSSWLYLFKKSNIKAGIVKWKSLKQVALEYIDYPKYTIAPTVLNILSIQGIVFVLAKFYSTEDLGNFGLTILILSAPLGLIGIAYRDVFYQKMTHLVTVDKDINKAIQFFKKSALGLFLVGLPICLVIYFFGPYIFSFVFGEKWARAGEFASILSISYLIKLVASPLSLVFNTVKKLKLMSAWQTLYFITTVITLGVCAYYLKLEVKTLFVIHVIHESILYLLYLVFEYSALKGFKTDQEN